MKSILKILLVFISLSQINLFSQEWRFRHLSVEDGLSQNTINCLYQDRYGLIWIGTEDGLNRYDGYQFKVFTHNPVDSASLSHSWIWDIKEDKNGNLWIATWQGLNRFDRNNDRFTRYLYGNESNNAINGDRPSTIALDSAGTLWVGIWGNGIKYYQEQEDRFIRPKNIKLPSNHVRKLYTDHSGILWIGTWNGLVAFDPSNNYFSKTTVYQNRAEDNGSISSNRILSIYEDSDNNLWIGTFDGGLNLFLPENKKFKRFKHEDKIPNSLSNDQISFIHENDKNSLLVGTLSGGLNLMDKGKGTFRHFRSQLDNNSALADNKLYSILRDRSGMFWIGGQGLNQLSNKLNRFPLFRHTPHNPYSLSDNKVWGFCEDEKENIWIATGNGLNLLKKNSYHFEAYKHDPLNKNSLSSNDISSLLYKDKKIWIGTNDRGLNIFNIADNTFSRILENPSIPQTKGINSIISLAFDKKQNLWIGTYDNGLILYDYKHRRFKKYTGDLNNSKKLTGNYITAIYCDRQGTMWIGGWGGGLCRFNAQQDNFTRFLHEENNTNSLISNIVHTIYETENNGKNILWIGTNSGLCYMDINDDSHKFYHVKINNKLDNNVIYAILEDIDGNLWLSGNQGVYNFNPRKMTVNHFTYHDGLQSNEFNTRACFKSKDGLIYFGGINGFNRFNPKNIKLSPYMPPVILTSFKVLDKPWQADTRLFNLSVVKLNHRQNFFSFEFSALDYNEPQSNRYRYKMEGFDENWIECGTRHYASYTNLDPGRYTLKVSGSNSDGIWSEKEVSLDIIITPPYWARWWFRLIIIFIIFTLFYLFHKIRIARLLEIERLRVQIASDLHDDIGSALTKIAINSEIIQNTQDRGKIKSAARSIGRVSRAVITTMSDIIWSIDARNDTIGNLLDRMKDLMADLLSPCEIQYNFSYKGLEPERKIAINLRQNLFLIFKEAINNVVRHSGADEVIIKLTYNSGHFTMKIKDNGQGFDLQNPSAGNGLKNMKMRAQRIGAQFKITANKETTVFLSMKSL